MIEPYTTKTTTEIVNALLSKIPPYGDFNIKDLLRGGQYIEGDAINIENLGIVSPLQITDVYNYLVSNGYANKRNDISAISVEFTDRGRKLKQCGSIEIFNLLDLEEKKEKSRQKDMVTYSFWITFSIAVSTIVAAVYYLILIIDYYSNLVGKKLPLYYGLAVTVFLLILGMLFGVSLTIGLILLKKSLKKKKEIVPYE